MEEMVEQLLVTAVVVVVVLPLVFTGVALVKISSLRREFEQLRQRLTQLQAEANSPVVTTASEPAVAEAEPVLFVAADTVADTAADNESFEEGASESRVPSPPPLPEVEMAQPAVTSLPVPPAPNPLNELLLGGDPLLKAGLVVLLFGVGFLLKYSVDHNLISLATRLSLIFLTGLAITGFGLWLPRLRPQRRGYALSLQGGGFGVMYLCIFAAFRFYNLLTPGTGFLLLIAVSGGCTLAALLQDSVALAAFALCGGFLAPLLLPDAGKFSQLFLWLTTLNAGVTALVWRRNWQLLAPPAFLFTLLDALYFRSWLHRPELLVTGQLFLAATLLLYLLISLLIAWSREMPPGPLNSLGKSLLFAVPMALFFLQWNLVAPLNQGRAWSALVLALLYGSIAFANRRGAALLFESLRGIAAVFFSLALFFAFDDSLTARLWAVEGAGMVWLGAQDDRRLTRLTGLVLSGVAGWLFLYAREAGAMTAWQLFFGGEIMALSLLFCAFVLEQAGGRETEGRPHRCKSLLPLLLLWIGLLFHSLAAYDLLTPLFFHNTAQNAARRSLLLLFWTLTVVGLLTVGRRLKSRMTAPTSAILPLVMLVALGFCLPPLSGLDHSPQPNHLLIGWQGWLAWPVAFAALIRVVCEVDHWWRRRLPLSADLFHLLVLFLLTSACSIELHWLVETVVAVFAWEVAVAVLIPGLFLLLLTGLLSGKGRTIRPFSLAPRTWAAGALLLAVGVALWVLFSAFSGRVSSEAWRPLLNAVTLPSLLGITALLYWIRAMARSDCLPGGVEKRLDVVLYCFAALLLVAVTGAVARNFHYLGEVPLTVRGLVDSSPFQAATAILWGGTALVLTTVASRKRLRRVWLCGAGLLGAVVVKLFVIDFAGSGTLARIFAFLVVGGVMLLIAWVSPLPPQRAGERDDREPVT